MKSNQFLNEGLADDAGRAEQDHEVQMARADCFYAAQAAIKLHKILGGVTEQQGLPGWVSEKVTLAADYLKNVAEYMEHELAAPMEPLPTINPGMVPQGAVMEDDGFISDAEYALATRLLASKANAADLYLGGLGKNADGTINVQIVPKSGGMGSVHVIDPVSGKEVQPERPATNMDLEEGIIGDIADKFKQAQTNRAAEKAKAEFLARKAAQAQRMAAQQKAMAAKQKAAAATKAWDTGGYDTAPKRGAMNRAAERDWVDNLEEGRFTVNAKTGAKLDPRTGAELPAKAKPVTSKQMWADADARAAAKKTAGPDLDTVWRKIEDVVGQIFPDGDPIDYLAPWLEKQGVRDFKIGDTINAAVRKHGYANLYDYYDSLKDMYGQDSGLGEGYEGDDRGDYHATARAANKASSMAKTREGHKRAADLHSRAATYGLSAGQDQSVIRDHQMAAHEHEQQAKKKLSEVSRDKLIRYADRAISQHGHAAFAARQHQPEADKREFEKLRDKRAKGISRAYSDERLGGKLRENAGNVDTDRLLEFLTGAWKTIRTQDMYSPEGKRTIQYIYDILRDDLMQGDFAGFERTWDKVGARYPDHLDELAEVAFEEAGLDPQHGTYEDFVAAASAVNEMSSAGATSVGSIGTASMPTVKKAKKRIEEALASGNYNVGLEDIGKPVLLNGKPGYNLISINYSPGGLVATLSDTKHGTTTSHNLDAITRAGTVAEMNLAPANSAQAAGATTATKNAIADKLKKSGNTQLAGKLRSGAGTFNKDELDAIVGADATVKPGIR